MPLFSMERTRRLAPWLLLLLLSGGMVWLERASRLPHVPSTVAKSGEPDFVATQARLLQYDEKGSPRYTLKATQITHFAKEEITELQNPTLESVEENAHLSLVSARARIQDNGKTWVFVQDVHLQQVQNNGVTIRTLQTDELHFFPSDERFHIPVPLVMNEGASQIKAHALHADKALGQIELQGNVQARLAPYSPSPP
jgi:lipopolysaccharide export system protein LptC